MSEQNQGQAGSETPGAGSEGKGSVAWESHNKLLDQLKAAKEKVQSMDSELVKLKEAEAKAVEAKLLEEKKLEEVIKLKDETIKQTKAMLDAQKKEAESIKKELIDGAKIQAVVDMLPGKLKKPDYYSFIDVDSIQIDPQSNAIDNDSVQKVANDFLKNYHELIEIKESKKMPYDAGGKSSSITKEQWLKLPLKEQKKRLHEVVK